MIRTNRLTMVSDVLIVMSTNAKLEKKKYKGC